MSELDKTILATYQAALPTLPVRAQFHFASRLYLWNQAPFARELLVSLRSEFTGYDVPEQALRELAAQTPPSLRSTGRLRAPYFERYPRLRTYERLLFRVLFLQTIYGLDGRQALLGIVPLGELQTLYEQLVRDSEALAFLSSFAVNYLYLFDRLLRNDEDRLNPGKLIADSERYMDKDDTLQRQLQAYTVTHCVIAESLFYGRPLNAEQKSLYLPLIHRLEERLNRVFNGYTLDVLYEYLVCCRLLGHDSPLADKIERLSQDNLHNGFITEPNKPLSGQTIRNAEHRNVLYLMSQLPYSKASHL